MVVTVNLLVYILLGAALVTCATSSTPFHFAQMQISVLELLRIYIQRTWLLTFVVHQQRAGHVHQREDENGQHVRAALEELWVPRFVQKIEVQFVIQSTWVTCVSCDQHQPSLQRHTAKIQHE